MAAHQLAEISLSHGQPAGHTSPVLTQATSKIMRSLCGRPLNRTHSAAPTAPSRVFDTFRRHLVVSFSLLTGSLCVSSLSFEDRISCRVQFEFSRPSRPRSVSSSSAAKENGPEHISNQFWTCNSHYFSAHIFSSRLRCGPMTAASRRRIFFSISAPEAGGLTKSLAVSKLLHSRRLRRPRTSPN